MARYVISLVERPAQWKPTSWDDVPPTPGAPRETLGDADDLFVAVRQAIQHNEAVELVGEHLGITRTRTDPFFDGTRGRQLVKIVPLNHPLSPLDCEALRLELKNRPEEERDILLVCLGIEHAAQDYVLTTLRGPRAPSGRVVVVAVEPLLFSPMELQSADLP